MADVYVPTLTPESMLDAYLLVGQSIVQRELHEPARESFIDMIRDVVGSRSEGSEFYSPEVEMLAALQAARYELVRPIALSKSVVGEIRYVADDEVHCWGSGATFAEAKADYEANLIEMYEDLSHSEEPLSRLAEETLNALRRHISQR